MDSPYLLTFLYNRIDGISILLLSVSEYIYGFAVCRGRAQSLSCPFPSSFGKSLCKASPKNGSHHLERLRTLRCNFFGINADHVECGHLYSIWLLCLCSGGHVSHPCSCLLCSIKCFTNSSCKFLIKLWIFIASPQMLSGSNCLQIVPSPLPPNSPYS